MDRLTATNRLNDGGRMIVENPQAADLDAPLTNSIIPQRGVGAVTYARATIATVTDHEGVMRNCIAGEARFLGARRVQNLFSYSQEADNAYWTKGHCTIIENAFTAPDGTMTMDKIVGTGTGTSYILRPMSVIAGRKYRMSIYGKANGKSRLEIKFITNLGSAIFDMSTGTITSLSGLTSNATITSDGNGIYRMSTLFSPTTTVSESALFSFFQSVGDQCYIWGMQLEDVTGQSIQTAGEYVSTNVLTNAPFHGSNVDGVKCFKTTLAGLPISPSILKGFLCEGARTNICNYSNLSASGWGLYFCTRTNNAGIAPDGTNSMVKIIPNAGTQYSYAYNVNITTTASVYTVSCYVKADGLNFVQLRFGAAISSGFANFDLLNGVVGTRSIWTSSGIEAVTGFPGVYRIWAVTNTVLAATAVTVIQIVPAANSGSGAPVTGDGVSGVMAWGMQIEAGAFPSSYIPTGVSGLTRNIDFLSYNVNNVINLKGAVYAEACLNLPGLTANDLSSRFIIDRGASGRFFYISSAISSINSFDGTNMLKGNVGTSMNGNVVKFATSWNGSTKSIYYGNTVPKTGPYVGTFGTGNINVGSSWNGTIRNVKVWKTPPTVAELTSITSQ